MKLFFWILLFLGLFAKAQIVQVSGIVKNVVDKKPIPFASIKIDNSTNCITDFNGKFTITIDSNAINFQIAAVGFNSSTKFVLKSNPFYAFYCTPLNNSANQNLQIQNKFAVDLVSAALQSKTINDPLQKLRTFKFKRYTKLVVTANPDSIVGKIDSVFINRKGVKNFKKIDSSDYKFKKIIVQHHLFEAEKVSQFQYNKVLKETVLGTKVAGLKEPIYELMGFNLQSFSIYNPVYQLLESKYVNPISKKGLLKYSFQFLDSLEIKGRQTALIYFRNKNKAKLDDLEGVLYVSPSSLHYCT